MGEAAAKIDGVELKRERLKLLHEKEKRLAKHSLEPFLYRYLKGYFSHAPGQFHRDIYADLEGLVNKTLIREDEDLGPVPYDSAAYAYPRAHGKTTTVSLGLVLWVIYCWEQMEHFTEPPFIVLVSDTVNQAKDRALDIRDEIESNDLLMKDFGDLVPTKRDQKKRGRGKKKWTEKDFTTSTGVRVVAVGSSSKVRGLVRSGRRPTLIIGDDMENDEAVSSVDLRNDLHRWINKALLPCGVEGKCLNIFVGTILHADSVLSRLLAPESMHAEFENSSYLKRRFAALYTEDGDPSIDGTVPLWPEFWPVHKLMARRAKVGSVAFTQEYLNQAIDDLSSLFPMAVLQAAMQRGKGSSFLYDVPIRIPYNEAISSWNLSSLQAKYPNAVQLCITGWDLAIVSSEKEAKRKNSDFTVGTTLTLDLNDRIKLRRIDRKRGMKPKELRERIIREQQIVGADHIIVENNAAQRLLEMDLRDVGLPIIGHTTTAVKHDVYEGVPAISYLLENERIDFCNANDAERTRILQLVSELNGLGLEAHDDMVMSLWIAICAVRRWQRKRDAERIKRLGRPPASYVFGFPTREAS